MLRAGLARTRKLDFAFFAGLHDAGFDLCRGVGQLTGALLAVMEPEDHFAARQGVQALFQLINISQAGLFNFGPGLVAIGAHQQCEVPMPALLPAVQFLALEGRLCQGR